MNLTPIQSLILTHNIALIDKFNLAKKYYVLAPQAAWPLKELPSEQWIKILNLNKNVNFVVLGGAQNINSIKLTSPIPGQVNDLSGKTTWSESLSIVKSASGVLGVDTGISHLGDLLGIPTHFFIGPSAFGYPSRNSSIVHEVSLPCKPCTKDGRGSCTNKIFKKCLIEIPINKLMLEDQKI